MIVIILLISFPILSVVLPFLLIITNTRIYAAYNAIIIAVLGHQWSGVFGQHLNPDVVNPLAYSVGVDLLKIITLVYVLSAPLAYLLAFNVKRRITRRSI